MRKMGAAAKISSSDVKIPQQTIMVKALRKAALGAFKIAGPVILRDKRTERGAEAVGRHPRD